MPIRETTAADLPITMGDLGYALVGIELNNTCNMACTFCPLPIREAAEASMELEDVRSILDQVALDPTVDLVTFHQFNEPLLYPHLWDCIEMARERGLRTLLVTNGATFTNRNVEKMLAHPPTMLRISAQCIKEENHTQTRGYKGRFETYINSLAKTMATLFDEDHGIEEIQCDLAIQQKIMNWKRKVSVTVGMSDHGDPTIFDETPETLKDALADFVRLIESYSRSFTYDESHHLENLKAFHQTDDGAFDLAYKLSDRICIAYKQFINGRRIRDYHAVEYGQCGNSNLGILANGDVTMCCYDYEGFTALGNVKREKLHDILLRGRSIVENIRRGGRLHCEGCKKCLGFPTRHGAAIRTARNFIRYGGDNTSRPLPETRPFRTLRQEE